MQRAPPGPQLACACLRPAADGEAAGISAGQHRYSHEPDDGLLNERFFRGEVGTCRLRLHVIPVFDRKSSYVNSVNN